MESLEARLMDRQESTMEELPDDYVGKSGAEEKSIEKKSTTEKEYTRTVDQVSGATIEQFNFFAQLELSSLDSDFQHRYTAKRWFELLRGYDAQFADQDETHNWWAMTRPFMFVKLITHATRILSFSKEDDFSVVLLEYEKRSVPLKRHLWQWRAAMQQVKKEDQFEFSEATLERALDVWWKVSCAVYLGHALMHHKAAQEAHQRQQGASL